MSSADQPILFPADWSPSAADPNAHIRLRRISELVLRGQLKVRRQMVRRSAPDPGASQPGACHGLGRRQAGARRSSSAGYEVAGVLGSIDLDRPLFSGPFI
jgi:hypothetical protein